MGVTADRSYAVLGEGATRAIAYVAMSRGRQNNEAFIYQRISGEADHEHSKPAAWDEIHRLRRGNKYSAAHYFRMILANDDQPRTIHTEAERTERHLLPDVVSDLLDRNEHDAACGVRYGANTPRRPAPGAGPGTPSGGREKRRTKAAAATSTGANSDPQFVRAVVQAHALPACRLVRWHSLLCRRRPFPRRRCWPPSASCPSTLPATVSKPNGTGAGALRSAG